MLCLNFINLIAISKLKKAKNGFISDLLHSKCRNNFLTHNELNVKTHKLSTKNCG